MESADESSISRFIGVLVLAIAVVLSACRSPRRRRPPPRNAAPAGESRAAAAQGLHASQDPDGQPDLQGFWTNSTYVPLERPQGVTKEFYTPDEARGSDQGCRGHGRPSRPSPEPRPTCTTTSASSGSIAASRQFATNLRTSLIVDPPDGKIPPVNAQGQKRAAERAAARKAAGGQYDSVQNMPIGSRCIIMGGAGPPMMNAGYNANYQIVQAPGYVMILTEMIHDARIIPLDNGRSRRRACVSGPDSRAAAGKATRSSSRQRISTARIAFRGAART